MWVHFYSTKASIPKSKSLICYNNKVISEVDMGEALHVVPIPLGEKDKDLAALEERIHKIEHIAIVEGTRMAVEAHWKSRSH
jgi:folate-dependent phosphoribosylglycinamide formyltransferase PurN